VLQRELEGAGQQVQQRRHLAQRVGQVLQQKGEGENGGEPAAM
jgi:hypothetical protein